MIEDSVSYENIKIKESASYWKETPVEESGRHAAILSEMPSGL